MLFGQFVGSWDADWTGLGTDGKPVRLHGEVHFGWVLSGRAIQDTWIVPPAREWTASKPPVGFFGTTIRFYDPSLDAWRSTWIDPPNGVVRRFIGRPIDEEIVLLRHEETPPTALALHRHHTQLVSLASGNTARPSIHVDLSPRHATSPITALTRTQSAPLRIDLAGPTGGSL